MVVELIKIENFKYANSENNVKCTFKCTDTGKLFQMLISLTFKHVDYFSGVVITNTAHHIIRDNLKIGKVFEGVKELTHFRDQKWVSKSWVGGRLDQFTKDIKVKN